MKAGTLKAPRKGLSSAFRSLPALSFAFLLAGCTSFDQTDDGNSKSVLLGKSFTISFPAVTEERAIQITKENIVRFLELRRNSPTGKDTFHFKAIGVGETEIHIPKDLNAPGGQDFVLTVNVVLGGSPY